MRCSFGKAAFFFLLIWWSLGIQEIAAQETAYAIRVIHPGISLTDSVEAVLRVKDGSPAPYFMDVASVVCGDTYCRVDTIRIYWNGLGQYAGLKLPEGIYLEKAEGAAFTPGDYHKLDQILADAASPLREMFKEELVAPSLGEGADAVTRPSIVADTSAYVKGAVWTCYTLWHWVHGGASLFVRHLQRSGMSTDALREELGGKDGDRLIFAIEALSLRHDYAETTIAAILAAMERTPAAWRQGMAYLYRLPAEQVEAVVLRCLQLPDRAFRLLALRLLERSTASHADAFWEKISPRILANPRFQEVDAFIRILEKRGAEVPAAISALIPLLQHENFIIARSVCWFLRDQELSKNQLQKLKAFQRKYADRL